MATKKEIELNHEAKADIPQMGGLTFAVEKQKAGYDGPTVDVFLPELPGGGSDGIKVDQYEHVTIANETGEQCYKVLRGETVAVPVPVFIALKERYGKKI